jgi:hypothetical protein
MRKSCKSEPLVVIDDGKHMVHGVCEDPLCQCRVCDMELLDELPYGFDDTTGKTVGQE